LSKFSLQKCKKNNFVLIKKIMFHNIIFSHIVLSRTAIQHTVSETHKLDKLNYSNVLPYSLSLQSPTLITSQSPTPLADKILFSALLHTATHCHGPDINMPLQQHAAYTLSLQRAYKK